MMIKLVLLMVCSMAAVWSAPDTPLYNLEVADQLFEEFIKTYQKQYENKERKNRFEIFKENLKKINELNMKSETATFGINEFSDLITVEAQHKLARSKPTPAKEDCPTMNLAMNINKGPLPDYFDWREHNKVTNVKKQGNCGSSWAFTAIGNLEGQYAIKHNQLIDFSAQQLVDCDRNNKGCISGSVVKAFSWIRDNGGIQAEQTYPYTAGDNDQCRFNQSKVVATVSSCFTLPKFTTTEDLKQILISTGPLAITDISFHDLINYKSGIVGECLPNDVFAALLVGYGSENGIPYWIMKNSWGEEWGERGYFRMAVNQGVFPCFTLTKITSAVVN